MKSIIHVNRQFIAMNAKDGGNRPVYTVKPKGNAVSRKARYAQSIDILGPSKLVYDGSQLSCGARAWIETDSELILHSETSFEEVKKMVGADKI